MQTSLDNRGEFCNNIKFFLLKNAVIVGELGNVISRTLFTSISKLRPILCICHVSAGNEIYQPLNCEG